MKRRFVVEADVDRLDRAIAEGLPEVSRRRARALIAAGAVFVAGKRCRVASRRITSRTPIVIHLEPAEATSEPSGTELPVLHEDERILVVNKPAFVHVNETESSARRSLVARLDRPELYVVHRLDRDTTGVLLFAKTREVAAALGEAFAAQAVDKHYVAVTSATPRETQVKARIAPDPRRPRTRRVASEGKAAETELRVADRLGPACAVHARPRTGRTHQIRVHLAHVGAPILGDIAYGGVAALRWGPYVLRATRPLLHARALTVTIAGRRSRFVAPWPADLAALREVGLSFGADGEVAFSA